MKQPDLAQIAKSVCYADINRLENEGARSFQPRFNFSISAIFWPAPNLLADFPARRGFDVVKKFLIDEEVHFAFLAEAVEGAVLVLPHAAMEIARHADINAARGLLMT